MPSNNPSKKNPPKKVCACICPECLERDKRALPYKCQQCRHRAELVDTTTPEGIELVRLLKASGKNCSAAAIQQRVGSDKMHWSMTGNNQPKK